MVLILLVGIGTAAFALFHAILEMKAAGQFWSGGQYTLACLLLLSGTFGKTAIVAWPVAGVILILNGHWIAGLTPPLLLGANLVNLALVRRKELSAYSAGTSTNLGSTVTSFVSYARAYLESRCGLTASQAEVLVLDPRLGPTMDQAMLALMSEDLPCGAAAEDLFDARDFDLSVMERTNSVLAEAAVGYPSREADILEYLRSIGHPLGDESIER